MAELRLSQEDIISRFRSVHGDLYDYSEFVYSHFNKKETIFCKKHGAFQKSYKLHFFSKSGCPECSKEDKYLSLDEFLERARKAHGDRYKYDQVKYVDNSTKVKIICEKHGEFNQEPSNHFNGSGCPKCSTKLRMVWTEDLDNFLRENYKKNGANWCAKELKTSTNSVISRAGVIKISRRRDSFHPFIPMNLWKNMLKAVKKKNLEFDIDEDFVYKLFLKQDKKCAISGIDVMFSKNRKENTASIDKIDSKKGYTKDNIQIVHKRFNILKWDNDEIELLEMCERTVDHLKKRFSCIVLEEFSHLDTVLPVRIFSNKPILQKDMNQAGWTGDDLF